jgi:hypothetical protein
MLRASLVAVAVLIAAPALADGEPDTARTDVPVPQADCVEKDKVVKKPAPPQAYGYQYQPQGYGYQYQPRGYGYQMRPAMMPPPPPMNAPMYPPMRGY